MSIIQCPECGKEISDRAEKCPNCGYPIHSATTKTPYNNQQNVSYSQPVVVKPYVEKQGQSVLGIVALVFSILGCTFWLGIILAIIDLCKKDGKKKTCSIIGLVISCIWFLLIVFASASSDENEPKNVETTVTQDISEEQEQVTKEEQQKENAPEEKTDYIEITSTELIDAYNENQVKCKQTYGGKKLKVSGIVKDVGTDIMDDVYVCLDHDTEMVFVGIQCYAKDEATENQIAELKEGDFITVVGEGECGSMSFSLRNAEIVEVSGTGSQEEDSNEDSSVDSDMTTAQRNALKSANNYLDLQAFSYNGLVEQLEYEKYSHEDAVYAADNCGADWNEQAAKKAKSYMEFSSFSKDRLIEQLEYEGLHTNRRFMVQNKTVIDFASENKTDKSASLGVLLFCACCKRKQSIKIRKTTLSYLRNFHINMLFYSFQAD